MTSSTTRTSIGQLPNFLVIGAMKAGTTSLYHYLRAHPQVFMSSVKELDFFAHEPNGSRSLDWYRRQFASAQQDSLAIGEASTIYSKFPRFRGVPERIAAEVPNVRLIYVIRHPIERIRSHYQHQVAVGAERAPVERAVFDNPIYLDYSRYAMQIEQYLPYFPQDHLLVITSEDLRHERLRTVRRVYGFLGVEPDYTPPNLDREFYRTGERVTYPPLAWRIRRALKRHLPASKRAKELVDAPFARWLRLAGHRNEGASASGAPSIPAEVRDSLVRLLEEDVQRLRDFVGPGFDGWGIA